MHTSSNLLWPPLRGLSWAAHGLAVLLLGLMAGFFATYSFNVNLATATLDGPTYALVQSAFNRHVRHTGFFLCFFGPPLCAALALLHSARERPGWWWLLAALGAAYALGIVVFTRQVNLPLNHLTESWTAATLPADWASTRAAWNRANLWRSACSGGLFALGLWSLVWRAWHQAGRPAGRLAGARGEARAAAGEGHGAAASSEPAC